MTDTLSDTDGDDDVDMVSVTDGEALSDEDTLGETVPESHGDALDD